jgi:hypothetical protein
MAMNTKDRQKMCSHCDGRIPYDADVCPYCASAQTGSPAQVPPQEAHHQSLQDSLTALYHPPYGGKTPTFLRNEEPTPANFNPPKEPMAEKRFQSTSAALGVPTIPVDQAESAAVDEGKSSFWPILLLSVGANLLTIGLLQLFFSDNGALRLEWKSDYWFVYCLGALPLFYLGFKKANLLK